MGNRLGATGGTVWGERENRSGGMAPRGGTGGMAPSEWRRGNGAGEMAPDEWRRGNDAGVMAPG